MKAISLWQPWASAIAAGLKTMETRSWETSYRGPLAIHAAKRWTGAEQDFLFSRMSGPNAEYFHRIGITRGADVPLGCIVATCEVYGCVSTNDEPPPFHTPASTESDWGNFSPDRFAWLLRNVTALAKPAPCAGRQGFFEWVQPPDTAHFFCTRCNQGPLMSWEKRPVGCAYCEHTTAP